MPTWNRKAVAAAVSITLKVKVKQFRLEYFYFDPSLSRACLKEKPCLLKDSPTTLFSIIVQNKKLFKLIK